ncbi:mono-/di-acylglycerol lipase [Striga asiatica]|uniref:Mono-/di-acylglycerol lipase n=1 Tax=Striga asiatica TaxID=4170 RepID=A0A5A7QHQ9_STRAF|nr:mono-/di-acylglycerol lipase [Striga asiatica]
MKVKKERMCLHILSPTLKTRPDNQDPTSKAVPQPPSPPRTWWVWAETAAPLRTTTAAKTAANAFKRELKHRRASCPRPSGSRMLLTDDGGIVMPPRESCSMFYVARGLDSSIDQVHDIDMPDTFASSVDGSEPIYEEEECNRKQVGRSCVIDDEFKDRISIKPDGLIQRIFKNSARWSKTISSSSGNLKVTFFCRLLLFPFLRLLALMQLLGTFTPSSSSSSKLVLGV